MSWNRTLREKLILILCGALILAFAFVEFVGKPIYLKQKAQKQMIENKIFFITKYYENLNQKDYYREKKKTSQKLSAQLNKMFLSPHQPALAAADLQKLLEGKARKTRISLIQVKTEKAKYMEGLLTIPVKVTVKSTLAGLSKFVHLIENDEKFLVVEELTIRRINKKDPEQLESRLLVNGFIQQRKSESPKKI